MARDIEAGKAFLRVSVREDLAGLRRTSKKLKAWGANIAKVGGALTGISAAVLGPLAGMSKAFADAGDQLHKMSMRTGVGAQALSELGHAAELSGTSLDAVGQAMQKMNRRIGRMTAGQGSRTQVEAMKELGLSLEELESMSPEQQFNTLADAMAGYGNQAQAAGLAQRAFGTEVDQLLPMFADGAAGIEAMRQEARDLGIALTDEDADSAAELTDAMARVTSSMKAAALQAGAALAPELTELGSRLTDVVGHVVDFVKENRQLVATVAKVAAVIGGVGVAIMGVGGTLALMGMAIGGIVSAFGAVASAMAMVLSPLGLIIASVAGATAAFVTLTDTGKSLGTSLGGVFSDLAAAIGSDFGNALGTVKETFGGVVDALQSGDMETAGNIALSGLKIAFLEATKEIRGRWVEFNQYLVGVLQGMAKAAIDAFQEIARAADKYLNLGDAAQGWAEWWQKGQVDLAVNRMEADLRDLEKRRDDMTKREYAVAKLAITTRGADETERAAAKSRQAAEDIQDFFGGDSDLLSGWKANIDQFGGTMQQELESQLQEQERSLAQARADLARSVADADMRAVEARTRDRWSAIESGMGADKAGEEDPEKQIKSAMSGVAAGTFSAAAARVMFAGEATTEEKQIAANTEETATILRRMNRQRTGAAFT